MNTNIILFLLLLALIGIVEAFPAPQDDRSFEFVSATETIDQAPTTTDSSSSTATDPPVFAATVGPSPPGIAPFSDPESEALQPGSTYVPTSSGGSESSTPSGLDPRLSLGQIFGISAGLTAVVLLGVFAIVASRRKRRAKKAAEATRVVGITAAPEDSDIRPPPPSYQEAVAGRRGMCEVDSGCVEECGGIRGSGR
jgi:hypothetical protein